MTKKNVSDRAVAEMMPDEINALRVVVKEFMSRIQNIDNEVELLKQDRKDLIEEYSTKLDLKTLQAALRVVKIQSTVAHKDAYDLFMEVLQDPTQ